MTPITTARPVPNQEEDLTCACWVRVCGKRSELLAAESQFLVPLYLLETNSEAESGYKYRENKVIGAEVDIPIAQHSRV